MQYSKIADMTLRVAVAFVFLYPPINAFGDPSAWVGYFPPFVEQFGSVETMLNVFGIIEVGIAFWILSGWKIVLPSLAAAGMLFGIVAFNLPEFQVLFRDLSIAGAALALAITHMPKKTI
jgi:hypothetical protein